jgi:hypothetical protein
MSTPELRECVAVNLDHLNRLVQIALDEFETLDLEVSVRRAYRIARLRGDADVAYPATNQPYVSRGGAQRSVREAQYRNRILAGIESSATSSRAMSAAIDDLAVRLDRLDELTQKGVHSDVSEAEMKFGLVQTYLLAGELLTFVESKP